MFLLSLFCFRQCVCFAIRCIKHRNVISFFYCVNVTAFLLKFYMYVISASNLYLYFTIFKYPLSTNKSTFMYAKAAQHNAVPLRRLFAYNNLTECACNRNCRFTGSYCYCAVGIGRECCRRHCYSALSRFKHACCFIIGVLGIIKCRAVIPLRMGLNTSRNTTLSACVIAVLPLLVIVNV